MSVKRTKCNNTSILITLGLLFSIILTVNKPISHFDSSEPELNPNLGYFKQDLWNDTWGDSMEQTFNDITFDNEGNIIVVGNSYSSGDDDIIIRKYNSTGHLLWNQTWGSSVIHERAEAVAIDKSNNIYITGYWYDGDNRIVILKYNCSGDKEWERVLDYGINEGSRGLGIAISNDDYVYVCGARVETVLFTPVPCYVILKYNTSGNEQWVKPIGSSLEKAGYLQDIIIDNQNNIF